MNPFRVPSSAQNTFKIGNMGHTLKFQASSVHLSISGDESQRKVSVYFLILIRQSKKKQIGVQKIKKR